MVHQRTASSDDNTGQTIVLCASMIRASAQQRTVRDLCVRAAGVSDLGYCSSDVPVPLMLDEADESLLIHKEKTAFCSHTYMTSCAQNII